VAYEAEWYLYSSMRQVLQTGGATSKPSHIPDRWAPLDKNPGEEIENYTDRSR
jgi:hypothetical protein